MCLQSISCSVPSMCWQLSSLAVVAAKGDGAISIYDFSGQLGPGHSGGHDNSSGQQPGLITADSCPANPAPTHNDNLLFLSVTPDQEV